MSLLNKFENISVNNLNRINKGVIETLREYSEKTHTQKVELQNQINFLKSYDSVNISFDFQETIDRLESIISYNQRSNVEKSFNTIKDFYELQDSYRDVKVLIKDATLVSEIVDGVFTYYENIDLDVVSKKQSYRDFRYFWDDTYRKEMPSMTKNGVITLPSFFYVYDGRYPKYLRNDRMYNIDFLERILNNCFNGINKKDNSLYNLRAESELSEATDYVKKGSVNVVNKHLKSVQAFSNNKLKLTFIDKETAFKFWEFYDMSDYKRS